MMRFRMRMRIGRISAVCLVIRTSTALDAHLYFDTITIIYLSLSSSSSNMWYIHYTIDRTLSAPQCHWAASRQLPAPPLLWWCVQSDGWCRWGIGLLPESKYFVTLQPALLHQRSSLLSTAQPVTHIRDSSAGCPCDGSLPRNGESGPITEPTPSWQCEASAGVAGRSIEAIQAGTVVISVGRSQMQFASGCLMYLCSLQPIYQSFYLSLFFPFNPHHSIHPSIHSLFHRSVRSGTFWQPVP